MGRNMSQRKAKAYQDIERLKANRRKDLIKCAAALAAIVVLVTVKLGLETSGILEVGNMAVGAAMMMAGIGLAILGGTSSVDFTRSGNEIRGIQASVGITKQDIKDYEQAKRDSRRSARMAAIRKPLSSSFPGVVTQGAGPLLPAGNVPQVEVKGLYQNSRLSRRA